MHEPLKTMFEIKAREEEKREKTNAFYSAFCAVLVSISSFICDKTNCNPFTLRQHLLILVTIISISWFLFLLKNGTKITYIKDMMSRHYQGEEGQIFKEIEGLPHQWVGVTTSYIEMILPLCFFFYAIYFFFHPL